MREGKDAGTEKKNSLTTSISETTAKKKKKNQRKGKFTNIL